MSLPHYTDTKFLENARDRYVCVRVCMCRCACMYVLYQMSLPHYTDTKFLENARDRCVCACGVHACVSVCVRV